MASFNSRYTWQIQIQKGLYVNLVFTHFDVYESPIIECDHDVVIITDFDLQHIPNILGRFGYIY